MAALSINGSSIGSELSALLMCDDLQPGDEVSYATAKAIYLYHPLGAKLVEAPVMMAQSQAREIAIPHSPEERVKEAFETEWKRIGADKIIFNLHRLARIYGIASIGLVQKDTDASEPVDFKSLWKSDIAFSVFDPLNTAGSLVGNLNPNAIGFLKTDGIAVSGSSYHRSRTVIAMNEEPIYLGYTNSSFGYVGRSVYQRTLYPLKSFVETMVADSMVARKAGLIVAKMEQPGSWGDQLMSAALGVKRTLLREARTDNVINIGPAESIETLDMQNVNAALEISRRNILDNIASGAGMPAVIINSQTFAEGFGEGTEDAKNVARFIDSMRVEMDPSYAFMDKVVQYRAWSPEFYSAIQSEFEDYADVPYETAFYEWVNNFSAKWPSLLIEPDSEKSKTSDVKLKALIAAFEAIGPALDPDNKALLVAWVADNINADGFMFPNPLELDIDALRQYVPPTPEPVEAPPKPFGSTA